MKETKRQAARIIARDPNGRVLLVRYARANGESFGATPGGGLEDGETFKQAALREASEELGVSNITLTPLWESMNSFVALDDLIHQEERFFLLECNASDLLSDVQAAHNKEGILETRWWSVAELESTEETFFPEDLAAKLRADSN